MLSKFTNHLMVSRKKSVTERVVQTTFDRVDTKLRRAPLVIFHEAADDIRPRGG